MIISKTISVRCIAPIAQKCKELGYDIPLRPKIENGKPSKKLTYDTSKVL